MLNASPNPRTAWRYPNKQMTMGFGNIELLGQRDGLKPNIVDKH